MAGQIEPFGKYLLLEKLASGGMAEVYLAKSTGANGVSKFLAIKRILPQYSEDPDFVKWFNDEAKIAVNLNHGNVVSIYDFGLGKKQFYIVMEYVEGKNLRQIINELKKQGIQFTVEQIVYMFKEVAAGLDHAHRSIDGSTGKPLNIIHRDMSPQNIMVSYEGEIKVIDFGIAKTDTQNEGTRGGQLKGKYGYMSPEQADYQDVDLRTDIFSLGIVFWELLANDRLFTANSESAILRKIREGQIPPIRKINPSVPPELEKIVHKTLAKDVNIRYQSASQLHRDLNRFLNTKYPEFSAQDFSVFIKNSFASTFADSKKKLVQYSALQGNFDQEKTHVTRTVTQTMTSSDDKAFANTVIQSSDRNDLLEIDGQAFDMSNKVKVDLNSLKGGQSQIRKTTISSHTNSSISAGTGTGRSRTGSHTHTGTHSQIIRGGSGISGEKVASWGMRLMIMACLIGGAYIFFQFSKENDSQTILRNIRNNFPDVMQGATAPTPREPMEAQRPVDDGTIVQSSTAEPGIYKMTLKSNPPGARIFLNNEDMTALTPFQLDLQPNKIYSLKLRKEGYIPYETKLRAAQNPSTFEATMLPMTDPAFVAITVANGGVNPIVEINGQVLTEKVPIEKYPVPANTPIRIFAKNPFTDLTDEVTVVVQPNQKRKVELILGRGKSRKR